MRKAEVDGQVGYYDDATENFYPEGTLKRAEVEGKTGLYNPDTEEFHEMAFDALPEKQGKRLPPVSIFSPVGAAWLGREALKSPETRDALAALPRGMVEQPAHSIQRAAGGGIRAAVELSEPGMLPLPSFVANPIQAAREKLLDIGARTQEYGEIMGRVKEEEATRGKGPWTKRLYGAGGSIGSNLLALPLGPEGAPLAFGLQAASEQYGKYRKMGVNPKNAALGSTIYGLAEYLPERFSMGKFFSGKIGQYIASEMLGEEITAAAQTAVDQGILDPSDTVSDALRKYGRTFGPVAEETFFQTLIQSLVMGGGRKMVGALAGEQRQPPAEEKPDFGVLGMTEEEAFTPASPQPEAAITPEERAGGPPAPPTTTPQFSEYDLSLLDELRSIIEQSAPAKKVGSATWVQDERGEPTGDVFVEPSLLPKHLRKQGITRSGSGSTLALAEKALRGEALTPKQHETLSGLIQQHGSGMGYAEEARFDAGLREEFQKLIDEGRHTEAFDLAYRDELTGLNNQKGWVRLENDNQLEGLDQGKSDLIKFKYFNDTYGDAFGDQILKTAGGYLHQQPNVRAFRIGGDEFAVVSTRNNPQDVTDAFENTNRMLQEHTFTGRKKDGRLYNIQGVSLLYGTGKNPSEAYESRRSNKERLIAARQYSDERGARPKSLVETEVQRPAAKPAEEVSTLSLTSPTEQVRPEKPKQEGLQLGQVRGEELRAPEREGRGVSMEETELGQATKEAKDREKQGGLFGMLKSERGAVGDLSPAPAFYSQMERVIGQKLGNKAFPEVIRAIITDPKNGIKQDEIKWSGIDDFLKEREGKGQITKQEVLDFIKANTVEIREVVKAQTASKVSNAMKSWLAGESPQTPKDWLDKQQRAEWQGQVEQRRGNSARARHLFDIADEAARMAEGINPETGSTAGQPKFASYQLPGGENYREMLLTLPWKKEHGTENLGKKGEYEIFMDGEFFSRTHNKQAAEDSVAAMRSNPENAQHTFEIRPTRQWTDLEKPLYTSSHWDEPNVLAHVRMNDRTDADGKKVLFIEEVQSDWHQQGKRIGYKNEESPFVQSMKEKYGDDWKNKQSPDELEQSLKEARDNPGVPPAPFSKSWPLLAMKRMIRYAAENGYDRIAWTTGEMQNERYDLSKQVDSIKYEIAPKTGEYAISVIEKGKDGYTGMGVYPKEKLADVVGKDIAEKIINGHGDVVDSSPDFKKVTKPESIGELAQDVFGSKMTAAMPLETMDGGMLTALQHNKIRRVVIAGLPVDVVNILTTKKFTPYQLFSNPDVVFNALPVDARNTVALGVLSSIRKTGASLRTKLSNLSETGRKGFLLPTLKASDLTPREVAGLLSPESIFHLGTSVSPKESTSTRTRTETSLLNDRGELTNDISPARLADLLNIHDAIVSGHEWIVKKKYQAENAKSITGENLKIEGTGMRGFYDQILPAEVNKYVKKWGAKAGETKIDTQSSFEQVRNQNQEKQSTVVPSITITPAMKSEVMYKGQALYVNPFADPKLIMKSAKEVKDLWDKSPVKETIDNILIKAGQKDDPRVRNEVVDDLNIISDKINTPHFIGEAHPEFAPVVHHGEGITRKRDQLITELHILEKPYYDLPKVQQKRVDAAIEVGTLKGKVWDDDQLRRGFRLDEEGITAYKGLRKKYDRALEAIRDFYVNELGGEPEQIDEWMKDLTGYAPLSRFGTWAVTLRGDKGRLLDFEVFESRAEARRFANESVAKEPALDVAVSKMQRGAEGILEGIDPSSLQLFAKIADIDPSISDPFLDQAREWFKGKGFRKHFIHRKKTPGYSKDWHRVHADYTVSLSNYLSRLEGVRRMREAVTGIDAKKKPKLAKYATDYIGYLQNPGPEAAKLRNALFLYYLGANIKSATLNLTQPITTGIPVLMQYGEGAPQRITKAAKDVVTNIKFRDGHPYFDHDALGPDLAAALREAEADATVNEQLVYEIMAKSRGEVLAKEGMRIARTMGHMFGTAEVFNRRTMFIAAYRMGQELEAAGKLPTKFKNVQDFAESVTKDSQFRYGRYNRPRIARGRVGATFFTFKTFQLQYAEMLMKLFKNDPQAAMTAMGIMFVLAGAAGIPFMDDLKKLFERTTGKNLDVAARDFAEAVTGDPQVGEVFMRGITRIGPIDMSGSIGLGDMVPDIDTISILGPAGGVAQNMAKAYQWAQKGEKARAVESMAPSALKGVMAAARIAREGHRDMKGALIFSGEGRWPLWMNVAAKAASFQPSDLSRAYERERAQAMIGGKAGEKKQAFVYRLARAELEKNVAETNRILGEIAKYNAGKDRSEQIKVSP
jgi:diguanylate cyclase (GGDEF)-like protein